MVPVGQWMPDYDKHASTYLFFPSLDQPYRHHLNIPMNKSDHKVKNFKTFEIFLGETSFKTYILVLFILAISVTASID